MVGINYLAMPTRKRKMIFDFRDPFAMIFPVLLYVVLENMFDLTIAMSVAFPMSIFMFVYKYFDANFRRLDWFMFPSAFFIALAFCFSKSLENTIFQPITSEVVFCVAFFVAILFYRQVCAWIMKRKGIKVCWG